VKAICRLETWLADVQTGVQSGLTNWAATEVAAQFFCKSEVRH